jgi:hypothetical protein
VRRGGDEERQIKKVLFLDQHFHREALKGIAVSVS